MRHVLAGFLSLMIASPAAVARGPDCQTELSTEPSAGSTMPLSLDLSGRPGVPLGTTGQAYVAVPMQPPGIACRDAKPPPSDTLRGEPGDTLGPPSRDLLRPGIPSVRVETR
jgi:hypothetical protein